MDKNDLTKLYLVKSRTRPNDMRPRFDNETYVDVLQIANESGIARNVVVMAIVKLWLTENKEKPAEEKLQKLLRIAEAS